MRAMERDSSSLSDEKVAEHASRLLYAAQAQADRLREETEQQVAVERAAAAALRDEAQRLHDDIAERHAAAAALEEEAVRRRADALEEASRRLEEALSAAEG